MFTNCQYIEVVFHLPKYLGCLSFTKDLGHLPFSKTMRFSSIGKSIEVVFNLSKNQSHRYQDKRLEWTKVRTGANTHGASNLNEIKNQCEHHIGGSDQ
jgi:hypothetical protein